MFVEHAPLELLRRHVDSLKKVAYLPSNSLRADSRSFVVVARLWPVNGQTARCCLENIEKRQAKTLLSKKTIYLYATLLGFFCDFSGVVLLARKRTNGSMLS